MSMILRYLQFTGAASLLTLSQLSYAGERIDQTVKTSESGLLTVEVRSGTVKLIGWDKSEVKVVGELADKAEGYRFEAHEDGDVLFKVELPKNRWGSSDGEKSTLSFYVPISKAYRFEGVNVDVNAEGLKGGGSVNTVNGDIEAEQLSGRVKLETVNGDIKTRTLSGKVSLNTVNGEIKDRNSNGELRVETVNGDIDLVTNATELFISNVNGDMDIDLSGSEEVEISTVNGDIKGKLSLATKGRLTFSSVGGDAELYFRGNLDASFNLETHAGGDIDNYLSDDRPKKERYGPGEKLRFRLGSGSADIEMDTVSGDITLRRAN